jgi:hypothetical protein
MKCTLVVILCVIVAIVAFTFGEMHNHLIAVKRLESFESSHIIFCKECCWKRAMYWKGDDPMEYIYTCTDKKELLWKRVP